MNRGVPGASGEGEGDNRESFQRLFVFVTWFESKPKFIQFQPALISSRVIFCHSYYKALITISHVDPLYLCAEKRRARIYHLVRSLCVSDAHTCDKYNFVGSIQNSLTEIMRIGRFLSIFCIGSERVVKSVSDPHMRLLSAFEARRSVVLRCRSKAKVLQPGVAQRNCCAIF